MTGEELGIISANLAALTGTAASVYERRLAHLCGLARSFRGSTLSDAMRGDYLAVTAGLAAPEQTGLTEKSFKALLSRCDRLELCRFICGALGQGGTTPPAETLLDRRLSEGIAENAPDGPDEPAHSRISYLRNYYADKAYNIFSASLDGPTVMYSSDFAGVCEDVYYGRAKYCILPVENSSDGMLTGFRTLIGKYELNLALTCDVRTQGEEAYTRFALLRRGIGIPFKARGKHKFEFTITFEENAATLCDILDAADAYGLRLNRINSLPASYSGRSLAYDLIFTCINEGLPEFITFLSLEAPQFSAVGIYTHIDLTD